MTLATHAGFRYLILDWDGTCVDSLARKIYNAGEIFADRFGVEPALVESAYRRYSGVARRLLFDDIAADILGRRLEEGEFDGLSALFTARNLQTVALAPLQPSVETTIRELRARKVEMAVSSSTAADELLPRVDSCTLRDCFDHVLPSRDGFRKGPEHVAHLAGLWGVHASQALVVGDEPLDVFLARQAGARVALVLHTIGRDEAEHARPDFVLSAFSDLQALCP